MDYFDREQEDDMLWEGKYCQGIIHIVENGDTLYKISRQHHVPLTRILLANPYVDVYNLQVGDEICVPMMKSKKKTDRKKAEEKEIIERMDMEEPMLRGSHYEIS